MLISFFIEVEWGELDYFLLDLFFGIGDVVLDVYFMFFVCKEVIIIILYFIVVFVVVRVGVMVLKIDYEVIGVVENMVYFESQLIGEKEYVFGKGGGLKFVEEFQIELLGQFLLSQFDWNEEDFVFFIYDELYCLGKIYGEIVSKIVFICENEKVVIGK